MPVPTVDKSSQSEFSMSHFLVLSLTGAVISEDLKKNLLLIAAITEGVSVQKDLVPLDALSLFGHALGLVDWLILSMTLELGDSQETVFRGGVWG